MNSTEKKRALLALGKKRKEEAYEGYHNIGFYHNGVYESDWVSPYTKSANNVDSDVFIMLQDWSSDESLSKPVFQDVVEYGHSIGYATNVNLKALLKKHLNLDLKDCYATNLFPFIKMAGMSSLIPMGDLVRAARDYGIPQIEIVNPKIVIAFGVPTFNALRRAAGLKPVRNLEEGIENPFLIGTSRVLCQSHPGQLGRNNRNKGGVNRVDADWANMNSGHSVNQPSELIEIPKEKAMKKTENQKPFTTEVKVISDGDFESLYDRFSRQLENSGNLFLTDNSGNRHQFMSENGKIKIWRSSGSHKPVSVEATKNMFNHNEHAGKSNGKVYTIQGLYSDDVRFCIALAKHLKSNQGI